MRASASSLRAALRAANSDTLDWAIDLLVFYINRQTTSQEAIDILLATTEGDDVFNERIGLVRQRAGV